MKQRSRYAPLLIMNALVVISATCLPSSSLAVDASQARKTDADLMWSAWECSEFAAIAAGPIVATQMFEVGYVAGHRFIDNLDVEDSKQFTGFGFDIYINAWGPTTEFSLGRLFAAAKRSAADQIQNRGVGLVAGSHMAFKEANCELLTPPKL